MARGMNWSKVRQDDLMRRPVPANERQVTAAQRRTIIGLCADRGVKRPNFKTITQAAASLEITRLQSLATNKQRDYLAELRRKHGIDDKVRIGISKAAASAEITALQNKERE